MYSLESFDLIVHNCAKLITGQALTIVPHRITTIMWQQHKVFLLGHFQDLVKNTNGKLLVGVNIGAPEEKKGRT